MDDDESESDSARSESPDVKPQSGIATVGEGHFACYVCDMSVPIQHLGIHNSCLTHELFTEMLKFVKERLSKHEKFKNTTTEYVNDGHYCDLCNLSFSDKSEHKLFKHNNNSNRLVMLRKWFGSFFGTECIDLDTESDLGTKLGTEIAELGQKQRGNRVRHVKWCDVCCVNIVTRNNMTVPLHEQGELHQSNVKNQMDYISKNWVYDKQKYTCYICNILVPVQYIGAHNSGVLHRMFSQLSGYVKERLVRYEASKKSGETSTEKETFCGVCNTTINSLKEHKRVPQHKKNNRKLRKLYKIFKYYFYQDIYKNLEKTGPITNYEYKKKKIKNRLIWCDVCRQNILCANGQRLYSHNLGPRHKANLKKINSAPNKSQRYNTRGNVNNKKQHKNTSRPPDKSNVNMGRQHDNNITNMGRQYDNSIINMGRQHDNSIMNMGQPFQATESHTYGQPDKSIVNNMGRPFQANEPRDSKYRQLDNSIVKNIVRPFQANEPRDPKYGQPDNSILNNMGRPFQANESRDSKYGQPDNCIVKNKVRPFQTESHSSTYGQTDNSILNNMGRLFQANEPRDSKYRQPDNCIVNMGRPFQANKLRSTDDQPESNIVRNAETHYGNNFGFSRPQNYTLNSDAKDSDPCGFNNNYGQHNNTSNIDQLPFQSLHQRLHGTNFGVRSASPAKLPDQTKSSPNSFQTYSSIEPWAIKLENRIVSKPEPFQSDNSGSPTQSYSLGFGNSGHLRPNHSGSNVSTRPFQANNHNVSLPEPFQSNSGSPTLAFGNSGSSRPDNLSPFQSNDPRSLAYGFDNNYSTSRLSDSTNKAMHSFDNNYGSSRHNIINPGTQPFSRASYRNNFGPTQSPDSNFMTNPFQSDLRPDNQGASTQNTADIMDDDRTYFVQVTNPRGTTREASSFDSLTDSSTMRDPQRFDRIADSRNPQRFDSLRVDRRDPQRFDSLRADSRDPQRFDTTADGRNPHRFDSTAGSREQRNTDRSKVRTKRERDKRKHCPVCNCEVPIFQLEDHLKGRKHIRLEQEKSRSQMKMNTIGFRSRMKEKREKEGGSTF